MLSRLTHSDELTCSSKVLYAHKGKKRYSVYSLVSTEVLTRPSSPSRHCTYRNHFNPPGDIPEQLAAYSAHTLSTALFMLGTHFAAGSTEAIWNKLSCPRTTKVPGVAGNRTSDLLITSPTPNQLSYFVPYYDDRLVQELYICTLRVLIVLHHISCIKKVYNSRLCFLLRELKMFTFLISKHDNARKSSRLCRFGYLSSISVLQTAPVG